VKESAIFERPKKFPKSINIIQIALKNQDELKDYEMSYKKYGLTKLLHYN
jgi:hypothetical protein